jgi:orotate phosphoribosyltransferase
VQLLRSLVEGLQFPALVIGVDRQEVGPDGKDAATAFTEATGIPVAPVVRMTDVLGYLDETGRLPAGPRHDCLVYLEEYGTEDARAWAQARR